MTEIWKPAVGYEGQYEVSIKGNVRSVDRVVLCCGEVKGQYLSRKKGRNLRPGRMPSGHLSVALGKGNSVCVHSLVLTTFIGEAPPKHECLHINGDPADNRLENLRWGTRSENIFDAIRHGVVRRKFTEADVRAIREKLANAERGVAARLAREFGVPDACIWNIKRGRTYAWVA